MEPNEITPVPLPAPKWLATPASLIVATLTVPELINTLPRKSLAGLASTITPVPLAVANDSKPFAATPLSLEAIVSVVPLAVPQLSPFAPSVSVPPVMVPPTVDCSELPPALASVRLLTAPSSSDPPFMLRAVRLLVTPLTARVPTPSFVSVKAPVRVPIEAPAALATSNSLLAVSVTFRDEKKPVSPVIVSRPPPSEIAVPVPMLASPATESVPPATVVVPP